MVEVVHLRWQVWCHQVLALVLVLVLSWRGLREQQVSMAWRETERRGPGRVLF